MGNKGDDTSEYYSRSADGRVTGKKKLQETAEYPEKFINEDAWLAHGIADVLFLCPVQRLIARKLGQAMSVYSRVE